MASPNIKEFTYRIERDLYQDCIERIARKIEADGEEALALALKEHGFEKVVHCRECKWYEDEICYQPDGDGRLLYWKREPDGFCAWGERKDT